MKIRRGGGMEIPEEPTDLEILELMRRSAQWLGITTEEYMEWVIRDPEGAADALAAVLPK